MTAVIQETPPQAARRLAQAVVRDAFRSEALHEYQLADGTPWCWRWRVRPSDGEKVMRPMHWNGAAYVAGEPAVPAEGKPLYRLPGLLADTEARVWIVEGEWCADHLHKLGLTATTSGSCSSASTADWTPLRGRHCMLWPDHDAPGRKYRVEVAAKLLALGCTVEILDVDALDLPPKGDVVDWLRAHPEATANDVLNLSRIVLAAPAMPTLHETPHVVLSRGSDVQPVAVDWLWNGWLAAGKLHLIGGAPGTGKTTIAATLAATITSGGRWPDGTGAAYGSVLVWSGEDDNADTLNPRLRAAGAHMSRIYVVEGMREGLERYPFDPARDMDALRRALVNIPDVRLIVIDPVVSAVSGDSHKNAEVRRGLQPLVDLAGQLRCALLGVTHFSKGTRGCDPVERITGSLAFGALARLVMVTAKQEAKDDQPERRVMLRAKSNIGPDGGGFVYDLRQGALPDHPEVSASSVLWGEAIHGTARQLLAEAEQVDEPSTDATGFLRDLLRHAPMAAKAIKAEALSAGYSMDAMHRAKKKLRAEAVKSGMSGGWYWRLPGTEDGEDGAQNRPPSSPSSEQKPPSSDTIREVFTL